MFILDVSCQNLSSLWEVRSKLLTWVIVPWGHKCVLSTSASSSFLLSLVAGWYQLWFLEPESKAKLTASSKVGLLSIPSYPSWGDHLLSPKMLPHTESRFKDGSVYLCQIFLWKDTLGTSQVVQWLRLLLLQGVQVQLLVRELRSCILPDAAQN